MPRGLRQCQDRTDQVNDSSAVSPPNLLPGPLARRLPAPCRLGGSAARPLACASGPLPPASPAPPSGVSAAGAGAAAPLPAAFPAAVLPRPICPPAPLGRASPAAAAAPPPSSTATSSAVSSSSSPDSFLNQEHLFLLPHTSLPTSSARFLLPALVVLWCQLALPPCLLSYISTFVSSESSAPVGAPGATLPLCSYLPPSSHGLPVPPLLAPRATPFPSPPLLPSRRRNICIFYDDITHL